MVVMSERSIFACALLFAIGSFSQLKFKGRDWRTGGLGLYVYRGCLLWCPVAGQTSYSCLAAPDFKARGRRAVRIGTEIGWFSEYEVGVHLSPLTPWRLMFSASA
jgi:hypothetical protein